MLTMQRQEMLQHAMELLSDARLWVADADHRDKVNYAMALSLLALHTGEEQVAANEVAAAASNWFAGPSGETFEALQASIARWRAALGVVPHIHEDGTSHAE